MLALLSLSAHAQLWKPITVYHVNPARFGPVPRNTDAADPLGDLFFEMFEVLNIPLACADPSVPPEKKPFECRNLESSDPTDVVNQITLEVPYASPFMPLTSGYAMCNIGNENGTDPLGRMCPPGGYCCYCSTGEWTPSHGPQTVPCNATLGLETLVTKWGRANNATNATRGCMHDYDCWAQRSGEKLLSKANPGYWYSTLDYGDCSTPWRQPQACTWRVRSVDKIVNAT